MKYFCFDLMIEKRREKEDEEEEMYPNKGEKASFSFAN